MNVGIVVIVLLIIMPLLVAMETVVMSIAAHPQSNEFCHYCYCWL